MRLTVLGCTGSVPGPDSPASCYLVEADGFRLLLDLGHGALGPLQAVLAPDEIGAIFLSHLHPDHCLDMTALAVFLRYGPTPPARPIPVLAPAGAAARLAGASYPGSPTTVFDGLFHFVPTATRFGPFTLTTTPVNHPVPTMAVRLEHSGTSLVYSGDTGECAALVTLARGTDAFLCEASWAGDPAPAPGLHLTGAQAGAHAQEAGVGRLLITHVPPWASTGAAVESARTTFAGPLDAVRAGAVYEV